MARILWYRDFWVVSSHTCPTIKTSRVVYAGTYVLVHADFEFLQQTGCARTTMPLWARRVSADPPRSGKEHWGSIAYNYYIVVGLPIVIRVPSEAKCSISSQLLHHYYFLVVLSRLCVGARRYLIALITITSPFQTISLLYCIVHQHFNSLYITIYDPFGDLSVGIFSTVALTGITFSQRTGGQLIFVRQYNQAVYFITR